MRRLLLRLALAALLAATLAPAAPRPAAAQGLITGLIEDLLSGPGFEVQLGVVRGGLGSITIIGIAVADDQGTWMTIDRLSLEWSPLALVRGNLRVASLTAGPVRVQRLPETPPAPEEPPAEEEAGPFDPAGLIPELPVNVYIDRFAVDQIVLDEPVLGARARLAVEGELQLAGTDEPVVLRTEITRTDDTPGRAALNLRYLPTEERLTAQLEVSEPAGGMIARAAALPGLPPVNVTLSGEGPIGDWQATLDASAGDVLDAEAQARIERIEEAYRFTLDAAAEVAALLDPELQPLVAGGVTLGARATVPDEGPIAIEQARVQAPAGTVSVDGAVDMTASTADLDYRVEAGDPAAFSGILPDTAWQGLTAAGRIAGPFDAPTVTADIEAAALRQADMAVGALSAELRASGPFDQADVTATVRAQDVTAPDASLGQVTLEAEASGDIAAPALTADLTVQDIAAADVTADRLTARLETEPAGTAEDGTQRLQVRSTGALSGLSVDDPALDPLLAQALEWSLAGTMTTGGAVDLERLAVSLGEASITAAGTLQNWGEQADLTLDADIPNLSVLAPIADMPLAGSVALSAEAELAADGAMSAMLDATLVSVETGIPQVDNLLGARTELALDAAMAADGAITVDTLSVDAARATLTADTLRIAEDELEGDWRLVLPDLAAIDPTLAGSIRAQGTLAGSFADPRVRATIDAENLVAAGREIPTATITLNLESLQPQPIGRVELTAVVSGLDTSLSTRFVVLDEAVRLDPLTVSIGSAGLSGSITATFAGMLDGQLTGNVANLSDFADLAGVPLAGSASLNATFATPQGQQRVEATVEARNLAAADAATINAATVNATVTNALEAPVIDARLTASGISSGEFSIAQITATANGGLDNLAVALDADGDPVSAQLRATVAMAGETTRIALAQLSVRYDNLPVTLAQPATIEIAPAGITIDRLVLALPDGNIVVAGRYGETALDLQVEVNSLALAQAQTFAPDLDLSGTLNGRASLSGSMAAPNGTFAFQATDVGFGAARAYGLRDVALSLEGAWRGGQLQAQAEVAVRDSRVAVTARLPLVMAEGVPTVPPGGNLSAQVEGNVDVALLNTVLAAQGATAEGTITIDLAVQGTLDNPQVSGTIALVDGSYNDVLLGLRLASIRATIAAEGERLVIREFTARTPNGGTIAIDGTVGLDPTAGLAVDLQVTMNNADPIATDIFTAVLTADLSIDGDLTERLVVAGTVTINQAEIRVPNQLPVSVPTIEVEEVNVPPEIAARRPAERDEQAAGPPLEIVLDITVRAPQQIYVRGRGINAEFGGDFQITGTADEPNVRGGLSMRRGTFDFLRNDFTFDQGDITFLGGRDLTPRLDFLATTQSSGFEIGIGITGPADDPALQLTSSPPLPEDEILSQLLFGQARGELTAFQAIQLAESAAALAGWGGTGGILSDVRSTLGLDRLDIESDEEGDVSVEAGRYVSEGVYLGVRQDVTGTNESEVQVEIEVTPNITVESGVGTNSSGRVGVNFEWEY